MQLNFQSSLLLSSVLPLCCHTVPIPTINVITTGTIATPAQAVVQVPAFLPMEAAGTMTVSKTRVAKTVAALGALGGLTAYALSSPETKSCVNTGLCNVGSAAAAILENFEYDSDDSDDSDDDDDDDVIVIRR
jgi:hypothetical protein